MADDYQRGYSDGVESAAKAFVKEYGEGITPKQISPAIAVTFIYDALSTPQPPAQAQRGLALLEWLHNTGHLLPKGRDFEGLLTDFNKAHP